MHDQAAVREKIIDTIRAVEPNLAEVQITDATSLADLKIDSVRLIELGVLLEDAFGTGVRFDDWLERERARSGHAYTLESLVASISKAGSA